MMKLIGTILGLCFAVVTRTDEVTTLRALLAESEAERARMASLLAEMAAERGELLSGREERRRGALA